MHAAGRPGDEAAEVSIWTVTNKAGEQLVITSRRSCTTRSHELGVDPGLVKDGVEAHLQALLADQIETLGDGWRLVRREYPTAIGPVDILARDAGGATVAVEIKRRGEIDGVEQLTRYLELLNRDPLARPGARHVRRPGDQAAGPGAGRPTAASTASSSTTTPCAASTTPSTRLF